MHEVSVAQSLLNAIEAEADLYRITSVTKVQISVGALAGVQVDSLVFAFDLLKEGTVAAGAVLDVVHVPAKGVCDVCGLDVEITSHFTACPRCGEPVLNMRDGRDLCLTRVEGETEQQ